MEEVLTVPATAVVERGQVQSVFVPDDDVARLRLVTLGALVDGQYDVLSGLDAGDRVILEPGGLRDGAPVQTRAVTP
jgi:hypothetical protein